MTERAEPVGELTRRRHETAISSGDIAAVRPTTPMMSITSDGTDIMIRVLGDFDDCAVDRACAVITDVIAHGGTIADVVLDLGATSSCSTSALQQITSLVGAGLRLSDAQRARRVRRGRSRHDDEQRRALPS